MKRELYLVVAAEARSDLVQHAVTARDHDRASIDKHVGADRGGISEQFNAGDRAGAEIVDQYAGMAGGGDIELRGVGGCEEVDRLEWALAQLDALHGMQGIAAGEERQGLRTKSSGDWRGDGGSDDVEAGGVEHQHVNAIGNRVAVGVPAVDVHVGQNFHEKLIGGPGQGSGTQIEAGGRLIVTGVEGGEIR